jgi:CubicO group peptidase (beta-lactamase class C family)
MTHLEKFKIMLLPKKLGILFLLALCSLTITGQTSFSFEKTTPEAAGISSKAVLDFVNAVEKEAVGIHSFMILRHGKVISQGWWEPYAAELPHVMNSLSKSFTSTAVGFAVQEGLLNIDDKVISFFPDKVPGNPSEYLKQMTVRNLLTMSTGQKREPPIISGGVNDTDWVKVFLATPIDDKPGEIFRYNSIATYMLSAIVTQVTGDKVVDYLDTRFFQPLLINKPEWDECPMGINTGGWGIQVITEDIAKLGQFYLQKGMWNGKQLLSAEWTEQATSLQIETSRTNGTESDWSKGYGFQFWQCTNDCYRGSGAGGQLCIVCPKSDLVVAITSGGGVATLMEKVWKHLLPAMEENALPEDEKALAALNEKCANLKLKTMEGDVTNKTANRISGKAFQLKENQQHFKSISFNFENGNNTVINIESDKGKTSFSAGYNNYVLAENGKSLPFAEKMLPMTATSGAWIDNNTYQVTIRFREMVGYYTYKFKFDGDKITWESSSHKNIIIGGWRKMPVLEGEMN